MWKILHSVYIKTKKVRFTAVNDAYDRFYFGFLPSIKVRPRVQDLYSLINVC